MKIFSLYLILRRHGVLENPFQEFDDFKNQSIAYVGVDCVLAGLSYVDDQIREDTRHVVESLLKQGISTYLLYGDKKNVAEYVASVVGILKENNCLVGIRENLLVYDS
ncbi:hypothetical protein HAX54_035886 [Datura stramonium]|uniref:Uncharacterized protein n=1 Tax=Datura stramonium TaxID=4076 RepID=A0ABS8VJU2_DATST|nr:hypothetical protein [Datura stramonium]